MKTYYVTLVYYIPRFCTFTVEADNIKALDLEADGMGEWKDDIDGCTPIEIEEIIEAT